MKIMLQYNLVSRSKSEMPNIFRDLQQLFFLHSKLYMTLGLRMGTRASIDESIFASTRVHFKYSVTCEVLYYRPRNETLV